MDPAHVPGKPVEQVQAPKLVERVRTAARQHSGHRALGAGASSPIEARLQAGPAVGPPERPAVFSADQVIDNIRRQMAVPRANSARAAEPPRKRIRRASYETPGTQASRPESRIRRATVADGVSHEGEGVDVRTGDAVQHSDTLRRVVDPSLGPQQRKQQMADRVRAAAPAAANAYDAYQPNDAGPAVYDTPPDLDPNKGQRPVYDTPPDLDPNKGQRPVYDTPPDLDPNKGQRPVYDAGPAADIYKGQRPVYDAGPAADIYKGQRPVSDAGPAGPAAASPAPPAPPAAPGPAVVPPAADDALDAEPAGAVPESPEVSKLLRKDFKYKDEKGHRQKTTPGAMDDHDSAMLGVYEHMARNIRLGRQDVRDLKAIQAGDNAQWGALVAAIPTHYGATPNGITKILELPRAEAIAAFEGRVNAWWENAKLEDLGNAISEEGVFTPAALEGREVEYQESPAQQAASTVTISGGTLKRSATHATAPGEPVDTSASVTHFSGKGAEIFVVGQDRDLHMASHKLGKFHHSSLLGGADVWMAGELKVTGGKITQMSNKSGHYLPPPGALTEYVQYLASLRVPLDFMIQGGPFMGGLQTQTAQAYLDGQGLAAPAAGPAEGAAEQPIGPTEKEDMKAWWAAVKRRVGEKTGEDDAALSARLKKDYQIMYKGRSSPTLWAKLDDQGSPLMNEGKMVPVRIKDFKSIIEKATGIAANQRPVHQRHLAGMSATGVPDIQDEMLLQ